MEKQRTSCVVIFFSLHDREVELAIWEADGKKRERSIHFCGKELIITSVVAKNCTPHLRINTHTHTYTHGKELTYFYLMLF